MIHSWHEIWTYLPDQPLIFSNPLFWLLLVIFIALYELFYRNSKAKHAYLLAISLFVYYKQGGVYVFLLLASIIINYFFSFLLNQRKQKQSRLLVLWLALLVNISSIAFYKYAYFIAEQLYLFTGIKIEVRNVLAEWWNTFMHGSFSIDTILLPAGISFFTFQGMSYLIDVYRRTQEPEKSIVNYGFYISFFPQLIAGPIVRASQFLPQLRLPFALTSQQFKHALFIIMCGLIKKLIIADYLALNYVDRVFDNHLYYSGFEILIAVYAYAMQIYCDFSGYSDIAIGLALLFGFHLAENFNSPYKAVSLTDFWHRWHISLSSWLKDYVYVSLGGNRRGKLRQYLNLLITMLIGGLWHGANWRFIIWGAIHGTGLMIDKILEPWTKKWRIPVFISILFTFHLVCLGWIFFRAQNIQIAIDMIYRIGVDQDVLLYADMIWGYRKFFLVFAFAFLIHFLPQQMKEQWRGYFIKLPIYGIILIVIILVIAIAYISNSGIQPFIYFKF